MTDTLERLGTLVERMFKPVEDSDRDWRWLVLSGFIVGLVVG